MGVYVSVPSHQACPLSASPGEFCDDPSSSAIRNTELSEIYICLSALSPLSERKVASNSTQKCAKVKAATQKEPETIPEWQQHRAVLT